MLKIDTTIARRFILGKQGLWPGRRWKGIEGTGQAMRVIEYLQLDPLQVIARSHDICLNSRVIDYTPSLWEEVTYQQREFFDWGGWLATRPMDELPYWRVVMHRERDGHSDCDQRVKKMLKEHADTINEMRDLFIERETLSNRDFKASNRNKTKNYRGSKDSSLALYYMWRSGEIMTHHRDNFERVYALTEVVAPEALIQKHSEEATDLFLFKKDLSFNGISKIKRTADAFHRGVPFSKKQQIIETLFANDDIIEITVDGWRGSYTILSEDIPLIEALIAGRIPESWTPLDTTTTEEVVFLAPLDQVSARGRAKTVFGFDYVWEVYKPESKRKYGYYTLPILWGDQLVARFDSKLDRETNTFIILGFWLEDEKLSENKSFAEALSRGFARFATFLGVDKIDSTAIHEPLLRKGIDTK